MIAKMFLIIIMLMMNADAAAATAAIDVEGSEDHETNDEDDMRITSLTNQIYQVDEQKKVLCLELKEVLVKCKFLKASDKFENVMKGTASRYVGIRKLLVEKFALALCTTPTMNKRTKKMQSWSDFDAYNNFDTLLAKINKIKISTVKMRQEDELKKQLVSVRAQLNRLKSEVITHWNLPGCEEHLAKLDEEKAEKKAEKVLATKTKESMIAGIFFVFITYR